MQSKIYFLDTSFFIESWNNYYRNVFFEKQNFFERLLKKSKSYNLYIHQQVYIEINQIDDDLNQWVKNNKNHFYTDEDSKAMDVAINKKSKEIHAKHKKLDSSGQGNADIFIISSALAFKEVRNNVAVVSNEKKKGGHHIPDVCSEENIEHLTVFDFITEIEMKFDSEK